MYSKSNLGKLEKLRVPRLQTLRRKGAAGMEPHETENGLEQEEDQKKDTA